MFEWERLEQARKEGRKRRSIALFKQFKSINIFNPDGANLSGNFIV